MQPNDTVEGRNANRRVLLVILSGAADTPEYRAQPVPDADAKLPAQDLAAPGESAAPASPTPAPPVSPVSTAAASSAPGANLPPAVTPSSR
jgi:hypothetical protein